MSNAIGTDEEKTPDAPPTEDTETPEPPAEDGETPEPPAEDGDTPEPPAEDGETPEPPVDDGETPAPPADDTETPEPPTDDGDTPEPPADDGDTPEPPAEDAETPEGFKDYKWGFTQYEGGYTPGDMNGTRSDAYTVNVKAGDIYFSFKFSNSVTFGVSIVFNLNLSLGVMEGLSVAASVAARAELLASLAVAHNMWGTYKYKTHSTYGVEDITSNLKGLRDSVTVLNQSATSLQNRASDLSSYVSKQRIRLLTNRKIDSLTTEVSTTATNAKNHMDSFAADMDVIRGAHTELDSRVTEATTKLQSSTAATTQLCATVTRNTGQLREGGEIDVEVAAVHADV